MIAGQQVTHDQTVTTCPDGCVQRAAPAAVNRLGMVFMREGPQVRVYLVTAVLSMAVITSCTSAAGTYIGARNHAATPSGVMSVACSDVASDAARLQQAIDSSSPGDVIEIGGKVCLLTRGISFLPDRSYVGQNTTGTVLKQDAGMSYVLASRAYVDNSSGTGGPVTISDLTVQCDGSGSTDGIVVLNWQADVEGVEVKGCGGSGIVDTNTTANGEAITNTSVNARFDNNFIRNVGRYGFEVYDSRNSVTDGFLEANFFASCGKDAIHLDNAAGWNISGNHLYGDAGDGIYASRLYGTTISNNYIEDFGSKQAAGTWYGIAGTSGGGNGSAIFGNKVFNDEGETASARYIYIGITRTNYGTGYLSVTGNVIVGVRPSDIGLSFDGGSNKLIVASSGNEVAGVGTIRRKTRSVVLTGGI
jgi:parallel beta-helix repeat protein